MTKRAKYVTWPRLRKPQFLAWLCELGLLFDALIFVITFSVVETNFYCALVEVTERDKEKKDERLI